MYVYGMMWKKYGHIFRKLPAFGAFGAPLPPSPRDWRITFPATSAKSSAKATSSAGTSMAAMGDDPSRGTTAALVRTTKIQWISHGKIMVNHGESWEKNRQILGK